MARVQSQNLSKEEKMYIIGEMFDIVTDLRSKKETIGFLMGLLTQSEAIMLARRIQIAKLLLKDSSYQDIQDELHVGESTISSVAQWLYGDNDQYKKQIIRHVKKSGKKKSSKYYDRILSPYGQLQIIKDLFNG